MQENQLRDALRGLRDHPPPPDSLARVRLSVARRTAPAPIPWRVAAVLAALALIALLVTVRLPEAQTLTLTAQAPPLIVSPLIISKAPPLVAPVAGKAARSIPMRPTLAPRAAGTVRIETPHAAGTVRIETEDPEVVIYLIGD
ncbi:MAG: hypothetical protein FJW40_04330 [Acidobacteria bacterium]|nr:hypothetical protein [Acidobacteriota bacterium]